MRDTAAQAHETDRTLGELARFGTVASVDLAAATCTVTAGDLITGPVKWLTLAGAALRIWSPPSIGEQVLLICPEGEIAAAVAMRGIHSTANPAPASDNAHSIHFDDAAVLRYDATAHHLSAVLPAGATMTITADGGLTITGPVSITGDVSITGAVTATGDVTGQGTSLHTHKHGLVKAGVDQSGVPV